MAAARDVPGWAIYFSTYDLLKRQVDQENRFYSFWVINAGGIAGITASLYGIPFDMIKTKQQVNDSKINSRSVFLSICKQSGMRGFFRGATPLLMRAYLDNMVALPLYDFLKL